MNDRTRTKESTIPVGTLPPGFAKRKQIPHDTEGARTGYGIETNNRIFGEIALNVFEQWEIMVEVGGKPPRLCDVLTNLVDPVEHVRARNEAWNGKRRFTYRLMENLERETTHRSAAHGENRPIKCSPTNAHNLFSIQQTPRRVVDPLAETRKAGGGG